MSRQNITTFLNKTLYHFYTKHCNISARYWPKIFTQSHKTIKSRKQFSSNRCFEKKDDPADPLFSPTPSITLNHPLYPAKSPSPLTPQIPIMKG